MSSFRRRSAVSQAVLCTALAFTTSMAFAQAPGDVNGDGLLDIADVGLIKDHLLERSPLTGDALTRADADGDGSVRTADLVYVVNHMTATSETTIMLPGDVPLVLVRVPAGNFVMGSPDTERSRNTDEGPTHTVSIAYDFYMGKYELTQQQWLALMGSWPGTAPSTTYGLGDNYPAYYISWFDCQNFITALNTHVTNTGQGPATFRLPSEAEWEHACRAGTQTRFFFGDSLDCADTDVDCAAGTLSGNRSDYMWWWFNCKGDANGAYGSKPVGTKLPNQFGLYDMSGNLWEWCQDWYHSSYTGAPADGSAWETPVGSYRVVRGGHWYLHAYYCRSAARADNTPDAPHHLIGFRLSRTP